MQDILNARDKLREDVLGLDGGYTTVARILKKSDVFVIKTLSPKNTPRLTTLESIKEAVEIAKLKQQSRIKRLIS